jgi:hypothetical protein
LESIQGRRALPRLIAIPSFCVSLGLTSSKHPKTIKRCPALFRAGNGFTIRRFLIAAFRISTSKGTLLSGPF